MRDKDHILASEHPVLSTGSETFCVMPFMHLNLRQEGSARICNRACLSIEIDGKPASLYEHSQEEIWNAPYMREVRRKMFDGEKIDACSWCYEHEDKYDQSHRTVSNVEWLAETGGFADTAEGRKLAMEAIAEASRENGFRERSNPSYFHLNLGRLCNLKCRMCNSGNSSQIERDPVHRQWAPANVNFDSGTVRWIDDTLKILPFPTHGVEQSGLNPVRRIHGVPVTWSDATGLGQVSLNVPKEDWPETVDVTIKNNIISHRDVSITVNGRTGFSGPVGVDGLLARLCVPPIQEMKADQQLEIEIRSTRPPLDGTPRQNAGVPIERIELRRASRSKRAPGASVLRSRFPDHGEWFDHDDLLFGEICRERSKLRMLGFTGGEPFLQEQVWRLLTHLVETGEASHVKLRSNTNLTTLKDWQFELLKQFEKLHIAASLDAIGPRFEYVRYPARSEKALVNLTRLATLPNATITLVPVVQILSIDDTVGLIQFAVEHGFELSLQHGYHPDYLSVTTLPRELRNEYARELTTAADICAHDEMRRNVLSIVEYLTGERDTCKPEVINRMMEFMNDLDAGRKQDFRVTYSRITEAFARAGHPWQHTHRYLGQKLRVPDVQ